MDPISIIGLTAAIVSAIFAVTGSPIMQRLWQKFRGLYGRACTSTRYLQQIGRQKLTTDLQQMLSGDSVLRAAAAQHYLTKGRGGGSGGGVVREVTFVRDREDGNTSDFSDWDD